MPVRPNPNLNPKWHPHPKALLAETPVRALKGMGGKLGDQVTAALPQVTTDPKPKPNPNPNPNLPAVVTWAPNPNPNPNRR